MQIPDKLYFKIGDVARIAGVRPYVVRYWETEFSALRPEKTRSGQRLYKRQDVQRLLDIKRLLYDEGYTIAGARRRLRGEAKAVAARPTVDQAWVDRLRKELRELIAIVDADARESGETET